ncbi:fumarylacetoacetate hydrolase family protein [Nocardioides sp. HM23]|uniref:fumarylacetoacetate hydrolase family protein n=1 Tax=Nocardioides bizhenqiangii TaxID=3095076 RepID=UPI002ACAD948|nr:fumarylacetoacetate hydrolase family protein [Nocardioides sp. HM23]MDZ5619439.1 fumarylacetoacetate hydrolase family protein [Nocardioides sp. HM23]
MTHLYGAFGPRGSDGGSRVGVRYGDRVLDLAAALDPELAAQVAGPNLDHLLAGGPAVWQQVFDAVGVLEPADEHLHDLADVRLLMPFTVADYVDFYSSEHHARNLGRILRPGQPELPPNWRHLPVGYHGRAGTVVVSGTDVVRPSGQRRTAESEVVFGPTTRLDIEAEVGYVVGVPSRLGSPVPLGAFADHVFGVCLVNDWSARDIQGWEYQPLGPFLGKSFATSVAAWVTPLAALDAAWVAPPPRDPQPLPYLDDAGTAPAGLDLRLEVRLNDNLVSVPPFAQMYWTGAQQLAHMTVNGASLRTGDLFASGTVSGPEPGERGSFIELSWNGAEPVELADGQERTFLEDGDEVVITATAPTADGGTIELGEVRGRVVAGRD